MNSEPGAGPRQREKASERERERERERDRNREREREKGAEGGRGGKRGERGREGERERGREGERVPGLRREFLAVSKGSERGTDRTPVHHEGVWAKAKRLQPATGRHVPMLTSICKKVTALAHAGTSFDFIWVYGLGNPKP